MDDKQKISELEALCNELLNEYREEAETLILEVETDFTADKLQKGLDRKIKTYGDRLKWILRG